VHNILQIHGKASDQSPITQTPQQFEKIYTSKTLESTSKNSEKREEGLAKKHKLEVLEEEGDP
jgi:hypothetical protein